MRISPRPRSHPSGRSPMPLFGWLRRGQDDERPPKSPVGRWAWLSGTRILTNTPYLIPKDDAEGDRLDLQHHLLKLVAGGNYRAPALASVFSPIPRFDFSSGRGKVYRPGLSAEDSVSTPQRLVCL